jgi:predicted nuclease with RNAse H fold
MTSEKLFPAMCPGMAELMEGGCEVQRQVSTTKVMTFINV